MKKNIVIKIEIITFYCALRRKLLLTCARMLVKIDDYFVTCLVKCGFFARRHLIRKMFYDGFLKKKN